MNTCATCKWWKAAEGLDLQGECPRIFEGDYMKDAACICGSDVDAFCCRPDFGCTLWQARDGVLGNMMTDGRSSWPKESE